MGVAMLGLPAKATLKSFEFNANATLSGILYKPYVITPATGVIAITGLTPLNDIVFPTGATHVSFTGCFGNINYATGVADVKLTNVQNVAINAAATTITLTPTAVPAGTGAKIYMLKLEFFQMVNGVQYTMKNGTYNALKVIEVI